MATIKEKLLELLEGHGLWPEEAEEIMKIAEAAPENEAMKGRWNEPTENYPKALLAGLWLGVKMHAIEWIEANKPFHFAKICLMDSTDGGGR